MKKIINKFLKLDNTKKLVISFVCISFLMIFSITIFNMISGNQTNTEPKIVIKQKDTSKKETDEKDKKGVENTEDKVVEDKEVDVNSSTTTNNATEQTINEQSNVNDSASSNVNNNDNVKPETPEVEMVSASISIVGLNNELIASGSVSVEKGQSVYEGLQKFANTNGFSITVNSPGKYAYITSIAGLYEKQHGANSGWLYQVNGVTPNLGSGHVKINQNDQIIWYYTHD